jgi:heme oxygenase
MSTWMLARLVRATRDLAGEADVNRTSLLGLPLTRATYVECLKQIYGFEVPIEAALAMTADLGNTVDLPSRKHLRRLEADLAVLGVEGSAPLAPVRGFRSCGEALGWIYVVDRNAHLHSTVQRQSSLPAELANATSFLGRSIRPGLDDLGVALDRVAQTPELADQIIDGARIAFGEQQAWFRQVGSKQHSASTCVA